MSRTVLPDADPRPAAPAAPAALAEPVAPADAAQASAPAAPARRRGLILAVLAAVAFMAQLDLFIVNVAVPEIGHSFPGSTLSSLSWVLNAYAIVFAALLVPAGRLADHYGRRRFLLIGLVVFTAASALCAVAPGLPVLVLARAVQAAGAAMIVPTSLGLLLPSFPKERHSMVVGVWAGVAAVAASAGPPLGGLLVAVDWRWIFLVNLPIGLATVLIGRRALPEIRAEHGARLPDAASSVSLLAAIALLTLTAVQAPQWGWGSGRTILLGVVTLAAIGFTVRRIIVHPHALIEAGLFRNRQFTVATVALFLFFLAFAAWLLMTVLFFQNVWHYDALKAGLAISPGPLAAAAFAVNSGRIAARFGRRIPAVVGPLLLVAATVYWLAVVPAHPAYAADFLPGMIVAGAGSGLTQAPLFAAAGTLPPDRATTGSAVLNMSRQVGSALGVAALVTLLSGSDPDTLAVFHRGWVFVGATALATALVSLVGIRPHTSAAGPVAASPAAAES
ncbi:MAG TPA: DHA2 family efflux MFS transporter permease subunit [Actinocrinis sp.]|nr:DHA2 family efflux MFS transporter permease subunit [Actinocrinis sp.]